MVKRNLFGPNLIVAPSVAQMEAFRNFTAERKRGDGESLGGIAGQRSSMSTIVCNLAIQGTAADLARISHK